MTIRIGVVMDPLHSINPKKDSSLAIMLEAQSRDWEVSTFQAEDIYLEGAKPFAKISILDINELSEPWYQIIDQEIRALEEYDVLLMRKDPPFDMHYIYITYLLELAEQAGVLVYNKPSSIRNANEKLFTAWFPQCMPPCLVATDIRKFKDFIYTHGDIIIKPLSDMGGKSIFRIKSDDPNINVILETITNDGQTFVMAQKYIPEILQGDKRILMINGEPVPYALARIPAAGETRANLAAGGSGKGVNLSERDFWICEQVGITLKEQGLLFVGLDIIGDFLTEINVTSPTCIRELDNIFTLNISARILDNIEANINDQSMNQ